jgi:hypothetical protein
MADKHKTLDTLAMDGKLMTRADSYEIKSSQVKQRPPAPAPMVKASSETVKIDNGRKPSKG